MQDEQLSSTASDDIYDVLRKIEYSFAIRFGPVELQHVKNFGELCDIVENKIQLVNTQNCTSQQAFYKIRKAFAASNCIVSIHPSSSLNILLPKRERKHLWRSIEKELGFKLAIIGPSSTVITIIFFAVLASFAAFFISAKVAGISLLISILAAKLAGKIGNTLEVITVRELVDKMTREQYAKSRRNPATFNRQEISQYIQTIFMDVTALPAAAFSREATFV